MEKALAVIIFVAGCSAHVKPVDTQLPAIERPWVLLSEHCNQTGGMVCCETDPFIRAGEMSLGLAQGLEQCGALVTQCVDLSGVNSMEMQSEKNELIKKLNSPWRSPWLWGAIGIAVGGVIGVGVAIGI